MYAVIIFLGFLFVAGCLGALIVGWIGGGSAAMTAGFIIAVIWAIYYMFKKN